MFEKKPTNPVVQQIVQEIQLVDGDALIPRDRFDFWVDELGYRHPKADNPDLYGQLVAAALLFAQRRAPAAAQLYALSLVDGRSS